LEKEWDTEKVLETSASSLVVTDTILGYLVDKRWFALSGITGFFLLQHAIMGWCPPLPLIRWLGIRTSNEITHEKEALLQIMKSQ